jgi:hypothetical protein
VSDSPASILFDEFGSPIATVSGIDGVRIGVDADLDLSTLTTEATASGIAQTVTSLDGKDFATETTLATLATDAKLELVRALLQSIDGKDYATETTLSNLEAKDFATESTLATLGSEATLSGIAQTTTSLDTKDFATETTLSGLAQNVVDITTTSGVAVPAGKSGIQVHAQDQTGLARYLEVIEDETAPGLFRLAISGKVSLQVSPPPEGGTKITYFADNPLAVSQAISPHDTSFVIPSGTLLVIQQIIAGCQGDSSADGSKTEVIFDDGTEHLIDRIYIMGTTQFGNYPDTSEARDGTVLSGNGTNTIVLRRTRLSNSSQEVDLVVRGYLV